jgi:hypothetical protein
LTDGTECQYGELRVNVDRLFISINGIKVQQDRDKKAAKIGQKWGKSGGVNGDEIGVLAVVSLFISMGYERFPMRKSSLFP